MWHYGIRFIDTHTGWGTRHMYTNWVKVYRKLRQRTILGMLMVNSGTVPLLHMVIFALVRINFARIRSVRCACTLTLYHMRRHLQAHEDYDTFRMCDKFINVHFALRDGRNAPNPVFLAAAFQELDIAYVTKKARKASMAQVTEQQQVFVASVPITFQDSYDDRVAQWEEFGFVSVSKFWGYDFGNETQCQRVASQVRVMLEVAKFMLRNAPAQQLNEVCSKPSIVTVCIAVLLRFTRCGVCMAKPFCNMVLLGEFSRIDNELWLMPDTNCTHGMLCQVPRTNYPHDMIATMNMMFRCKLNYT